MKNKAYDIEFWRKPGETDAETRERVYEMVKKEGFIKCFKLSYIDSLNLIIGTRFNALFDRVAVRLVTGMKKIGESIGIFIMICFISPFLFFTVPFYLINTIIMRYRVLFSIGAITWYGKRLKN